MPVSTRTNSLIRGLGGKGINIFRRPIYIFWLSLLVVAFFSLTFGLNRLYAQKEQQLSRYWYGRAQNALAADQAQEAISDLRNALLYSHESSQYLFTLAQALEAAGRTQEARSYLLGLLEDEPGNGRLNLELAHLSQKENDVTRAIRYFNGAIYGAWESNPLTQRQQARQELVTYLLEKGLNTQARGELLTYTTEMPKTAPADLWVANAFSRLGDDRSGLDFYKVSLRLNRHDAAAALGAGEAAFRLRRYGEALSYFKEATVLRSDPNTAQWLELTSAVLELNPFESRVSAEERRHRLILAMDLADRHLRTCAQSQTPPQGTATSSPAQSLRTQWIEIDSHLQHARSDSDVVQLLAPAGNLVTTIEQQSGCGPATVADQALLQIYRNAEELQP